MARRRKKHSGGTNPVRKWVKRILSGVSTAVIAIGASHGVISTAVVTSQDGDVAAIPNRLGYYYSGFDAKAGVFDKDQAVRSVLTILTAVGAGLLIRWGAKRA